MFGLFSLSLGDDILEASDVILLRLDHLFRAADLRADLLDRLVKLGILFNVPGALCILLLLYVILDDGILLELTDVASHPLEVSLELSDLGVGLKQVLGVQVTIGAHLLVKIELKLEFGFGLEVLLLKLGDQVILELDLFEALIVLGILGSGLLGICLSPCPSLT